MRVIYKILILLAVLCWIPGAAPDVRAEADYSLYRELLQKYVKNGVVDYGGFKGEEVGLDAFLLVLERTDPDTLGRDEQFAFYINAYNAWTIKLILTGYPGVESIKDLGGLFKSPWKKKLAKTAGRVLTLDQIEHEILRPQFKDPRIHFAVNCASKSCPPLLSTPYTGARINRQLDQVTEAFINNTERNRLDGDILYVSKIFKWYGRDFNQDIVGFFKRYATGDLKASLERRGSDIKVKYLDYDWSLNGY